MTRVFINGFGRIGRTVLRAWAGGGWPDLQIVGINDIAAPDLCAHLFEYDSVFGPFAGDVRLGGNALHVNGIAVPMQQIKRRWRLAHQTAFYRRPVNQFVRAKIAKRA